MLAHVRAKMAQLAYFPPREVLQTTNSTHNCTGCCLLVVAHATMALQAAASFLGRLSSYPSISKRSTLQTKWTHSLQNSTEASRARCQ